MKAQILLKTIKQILFFCCSLAFILSLFFSTADARSENRSLKNDSIKNDLIKNDLIKNDSAENNLFANDSQENIFDQNSGTDISSVLVPQQTARPNIILILLDDVGYGDFGCLGSPVAKTPNIDLLAEQSVRLTNFHVSPTCSPTRAALLTGRHEFHSGVTHTILERERLALSSTTIAQVLCQNGYSTGIFGKWHLGDEPAYQPEQRGFNEVFIHGGGGIGQTYPGSCGDVPNNRYNDPTINHNGKFVRTQGFCTDVFFRQCLLWMSEQQQQKRPFFAYLALNAVHEPLWECPRECFNRFAENSQMTEKQRLFYGMLANIDDNIGRLLDWLEEKNLSESTLLIFMTDNGTGCPGSFNAGMRGRKASPFEGGIRVPCFLYWKGHILSGDRNQLTAHLDIFPTLAELSQTSQNDQFSKSNQNNQMTQDIQAEQKTQEIQNTQNIQNEQKTQNNPNTKNTKNIQNIKDTQSIKDVQRSKKSPILEGRSLVPLFQYPEAVWADRFLFTHVGRWPKQEAEKFKYQNCSVRNSRFALVNNTKLFDLQLDPGQNRDISQKHPEIVKTLRTAYDQWWNEILPDLVNENVSRPAQNPYKQRYWEQFPF